MDRVGVPSGREVFRVLCKEGSEFARRAAQSLRDGIATARRIREEQKQLVELSSAEVARVRSNEVKGLPPTYFPSVCTEEAVLQMPYRAIAGTDMITSSVGFGASGIAGVFNPVPHKVALETVHEAMRLGINVYDTAPLYGYDRSGERILGEALSHYPRESYYITTKVGRDLRKVEDDILGGHRWTSALAYDRESVIESVYRSLDALKVDYLDVVWVHDPHFCKSFRQIRQGTLPALQELKEAGLVRYIGLAGYDISVIHIVVKNQLWDRGTGTHHFELPHVDVVQAPGQYTILNRGMTSTRIKPFRLLEYLREYGIGVVNAAPLGTGLFTPRGPPRWHPAGEEIRRACRHWVDYCLKYNVDPVRPAFFFAHRQKAFGTNFTSFCSPSEVRTIVDVARSPILSNAESHCMNYGYDLFGKILVPTWKEPQAMYNADGVLREDATGANHMGSKEAAAQGFIKLRGSVYLASSTKRLSGSYHTE